MARLGKPGKKRARHPYTTNTDTTVQRTYNTLSQMLTETQGPNPIGLNGKTFTYTFDDAGGRESIEYPSGFTIDYTSDAVGRWNLLEDSNGNDLVTNTFYGGGFRYATIDYLNGTDVAMGYDGFKFLTDIDHTDSGSTTFAGFDYAYDEMGNPLWVEHVHDSGAGNIYAYDAAYRLESALMGSADPSGEAADDDWADYAHVVKIDYNMDDVSNRTSKVDTPYQRSATTVSYTADELNQYTLIGANSQTHDDNGNLTDDGTYDIAYDYRNNLVKVTYGAVVLSECEFDAFSRRKQQITADGNFTTVYFYDGEHVVEEYDGSDEILRKFVYGQRIDEIRAMISPDYADVDDDQNTSEVMNFYYHMSLLGTVTHITDEGENVVESYEYTPYGETTIKDLNGSTISTSAIENPYRYTARRQDDSTGLYHYRRRAYDPERGRFLQRDPLGYVDGLSLHNYVASRPSAFADPLGLVGPAGEGDAAPGQGCNTHLGGDYTGAGTSASTESSDAQSGEAEETSESECGGVSNGTDDTIKVLVDGKWVDVKPGMPSLLGQDVDAIAVPGRSDVYKIINGMEATVSEVDGKYKISTVIWAKMSFGEWLEAQLKAIVAEGWVDPQDEFGKKVDDPWPTDDGE